VIDVRNNFVDGLDLDSALLTLPKSAYKDALNVTRDAIAGNHDNSLTNVVGNQIRSYELPGGLNQVVGAYGYTLRNAIIYFVWNEYDQDSILYYDKTANTTTKIFQNLTDSGDVDLLGLTRNTKITSIAVYPRQNSEGDLLFFLDGEGRPTTMNITRFIAGEYTPVTRDIINVHKRPPLAPPSYVYGNDGTHTVNNLRGKFFRFKYRWFYDDFERSTTSPVSAVQIPTDLLDDEFTNVATNNNQLTIVVNGGPKNVSKIEVLVSIANKTNEWSDFQLVESISKSEFAIGDDTDYSYVFYNDATYPVINVPESQLLFDTIPFNANAMCMPNGNVLMYSGITEGIDRDLEANVDIQVLQVEAGSGTPTGTLNGVVTINLDNALQQLFSIEFSGAPATGTVIEVEVLEPSSGNDYLAATYTTIDGDSPATIVIALAASFNALNEVFFGSSTGNTVGVVANSIFDPKREFSSLTITPPASAADDNSIATWPWSNQRSIGLVYFNQEGVTNGVLYTEGITFPNYQETGGSVLLPYINAKIYHVPPIWAYSYQWVVTKTGFQNLFFECVSVNDTETDYIYFNIENLPLNQTKNPTTAAVISWTFQDGDRMRLIKQVSDGFIWGPSYDIAVEGIVVDPVINNVATTGTYIKVKNIPPFTALTVAFATDFFVIELFREGQASATDENQVYYEIGVQFPIIDAGTADRVHGGEVTDQSTNYLTPAEVNIYSGDWYFRVRTVYTSETGQATFFCQDKNIIDSYISAVSTVDGRPLVVDVNQRESYYSATWRHGQAYQPNTNVNGLNRFYPADVDDVDISYGDIMRTEVNDRRVWVFQKFKCGQIPIFSQINREPNGTQVNVVTSQLLNPIDYYAWDGGIGTASTSLVIKRYVAYFVDNINGTILRLSKDGVTPLSILYKVNSWANENIPLRTGNYFIYGGFDNRLGNYVIGLEAVGSSDAQTLAFNEDRNSFESFLSYKPEMMVSLGTTFASFFEGHLWTHDSTTYNNFYGYQYDSTVTFVFNDVPLQKKTWQNLTLLASGIWDCPEIITNVNSYGATPQTSNIGTSEFQILEGQPTTTFKRATNSRGGKINGDFLKGSYVVVKFRKQNASSLEYLNTISVYYVGSPLTKVN
jgi:hypothetical protein